jgi:hypothetical protein
MIKFMGDRNGRPLLGFGLSRGNCEKLLAGKPIFIDLKVMLRNCDADMNEATVLIFGGETEEAMQADLSKLVGPLPEGIPHHEEN